MMSYLDMKIILDNPIAAHSNYFSFSILYVLHLYVFCTTFIHADISGEKNIRYS